MPHRADCCFVCKQTYEAHNTRVKCSSFEFVAPSSRNNRDIEFSVPFKSSSSEAIYAVRKWRQGDFSCNCVGWRNYRKCKHIEQVKANPSQFMGGLKGGVAPGSVQGIVKGLKEKMAQMEAAVKSGNPIELARIQAEVEYNRELFKAAGEGLSEEFERVAANIKSHLLGEEKPNKNTAGASESVGDIDDPFSNLK